MRQVAYTYTHSHLISSFVTLLLTYLTEHDHARLAFYVVRTSKYLLLYRQLTQYWSNLGTVASCYMDAKDDPHDYRYAYLQ